MKLIIFLLMVGITCGGVLAAIALNLNSEHERFDYHLDLKGDSIQIKTDLGVDTTIHFDELEEFIIRDNL